MLPIPGPDRTATGRSIRDDLKNFNFTISGPNTFISSAPGPANDHEVLLLSLLVVSVASLKAAEIKEWAAEVAREEPRLVQLGSS